MNVPTKAPSLVVVFETEMPVRVVSSDVGADAERAFAWVLSDESRATTFAAACELAATAAPAGKETG